ncbi:endonuclease/exonuclease/phosphatase family protein [Vibrio sp. T187]|uniref:endonuclease/exonuclease/phosphatase family protein n=1 Tax=Vibrio TaxID=662 RepID=UPI0010C989B1|nr:MULTISPECIES: endonuclease/exonuclease/phosphatase family protein [Vibrio]MBW3696177.1 endonuclease/exonuclease/phosphatase family protein [Vibrio sp. T187]
MTTSSAITFTTINLLNYLEPPNAYYEFENIYAQDEWQKKQNWFSHAITALDSDVIAFQEVFSPESLRQLVSSLGYDFFEVVDAPKIESDYLFFAPVVAIASKYPIKQCQPVTADQNLLQAFELADEFSFNRTPIHATITLPHLQDTDIYVVHFKSQRGTETKKDYSGPPHAFTSDDFTPSPTLNQLHEQQFGSWISTVQRGYEANLLHRYISLQRSKTRQPVVLMGDFNKPLTSDEFKGLLSYQLNRDEESQYWLSEFRLRDSWDLYHQVKESDLLEERPATHYFGGKGSTLDYILMSNEFDCQHSLSLMEITEYQVVDRHIINPEFERDHFSTDHALVSVTAHVRTG